MTVIITVTVMLVCVSAYQTMDIKWTAHLTDVSVHINNRKMLVKLVKLKISSVILGGLHLL